MGKAAKRPAQNTEAQPVSPIKRSKDDKVNFAFSKKDSTKTLKPENFKGSSIPENGNIKQGTNSDRSPKKTGRKLNGDMNSDTRSFKGGTFTKKTATQAVNWAEFKKKKKELRTKRRENKDLNDVLPKAKQLGEKIRRKTLEGGK